MGTAKLSCHTYHEVLCCISAAGVVTGGLELMKSAWRRRRAPYHCSSHSGKARHLHSVRGQLTISLCTFRGNTFGAMGSCGNVERKTQPWPLPLKAWTRITLRDLWDAKRASFFHSRRSSAAPCYRHSSAPQPTPIHPLKKCLRCIYYSLRAFLWPFPCFHWLIFSMRQR